MDAECPRRREVALHRSQQRRDPFQVDLGADAADQDAPAELPVLVDVVDLETRASAGASPPASHHPRRATRCRVRPSRSSRARPAVRDHRGTRVARHEHPRAAGSTPRAEGPPAHVASWHDSPRSTPTATRPKVLSWGHHHPDDRVKSSSPRLCRYRVRVMVPFCAPRPAENVLRRVLSAFAGAISAFAHLNALGERQIASCQGADVS